MKSMIKRRNFINGTVLGAISTTTPIISRASGLFEINKRSYRKPIAFATWDNRRATRGSIDVILNGGSALDAVEAGARVPESDPEYMSVCYG